jgi:hypothetical protein
MQAERVSDACEPKPNGSHQVSVTPAFTSPAQLIFSLQDHTHHFLQTIFRKSFGRGRLITLRGSSPRSLLLFINAMNSLLTITAVYAATTILFYALSYITSPKASQLCSFTGRTLASIGALVICATYGVFASIFLRIIGKAGLSQWTVARSFKYTMWWFTGVSFDIFEGKEYLETRPAVFVGNHQT